VGGASSQKSKLGGQAALHGTDPVPGLADAIAKSSGSLGANLRDIGGACEAPVGSDQLQKPDIPDTVTAGVERSHSAAGESE